MMVASATEKVPCNHSMIIEEMGRAHELTRQLQAIVLSSDSSSTELTRDLFKGILRSFSVVLDELSPRPHHAQAVDSVDGRKKRRKLASEETNLTTVPYDDGYQWKKYGQKQIKNSKFPRSYYRCAYHRDQGCPATKAVQQKDGNHDDPPKFSVTFNKQHTCKIVETSLLYVMDSSSNYKDNSTFILESSSKKVEELTRINHNKSSSSIEEFKLDEMLLSGPASPVQTPLMEDMIAPISIWDFGTEWDTNAIDGLGHVYDVNCFHD